MTNNQIIKFHINDLNYVLNDSQIKLNLSRAALLMCKAIKNNGTIYVAGNGGSAAIANHLLCDFSKGIVERTNYFPKVVSLSNSAELITAISNDTDFSNIFLNQVRGKLNLNDLVILISSSGKSKNIIKLAKYLKQQKISFIVLVGFESGATILKSASVLLHLKSSDYGVIEDASQAIMHILAKLGVATLNEKF
jgi:phosphoheptose isomerase